MLHIAADLIRPYNDDTIELAVLGLLHSQCRKPMQGTAAMLSAKCYVSGDHNLDVRSGEFFLSWCMDLVFDPRDRCSNWCIEQ